MKRRLVLALVTIATLLYAGDALAQGPSPHAATLTWDWTQGTGGAGTGFNVYRKTGTAPFALIGTLPAITFRIYADTESVSNPLVEGTTYTYEVTTLGFGGSESAPSNTTDATIPKRANAPTNVQNSVK